MAVFAPLIACSIWIGIYPKPLFDVLKQPVNEIVQRVRPEYFVAPPVSAGGVLAAAQTPPGNTPAATGGAR
jgi:hypothetical protein